MYQTRGKWESVLSLSRVTSSPLITRFLFKQYRAVFCGNDLVSWMVARGLAQSRETAVTYGQNLLEGRVIAHVEEEHYFHDESFFYRFLDEPTDQ